MADEQEEGTEKKGGLIKIIILAVAGLVVIGAAVAGTLFFTGFFDKKAAAEIAEAVEKAEAPPGVAEGPSGTKGGGDAPKGEAPKAAEAKGGGDAKGGAAKDSRPVPRPKQTPDKVRFEQTYMELERTLLSNITNSRKVISLKLAIMTYYDQRVFDNVKKHEFALRSAILDVVRQTTEADIVKPSFRLDLAEKIRLTMNALLEKYEDFGGIEEVHFTEFVVQ
jgi:flagellar FliL protein